MMTGYDCGPDVFHKNDQEESRIELRLDPKGKHAALLTIDCIVSFNIFYKLSKGAKIRNRYNQVPHLTQDANGKVTNS